MRPLIAQKARLSQRSRLCLVRATLRTEGTPAMSPSLEIFRHSPNLRRRRLRPKVGVVQRLLEPRGSAWLIIALIVLDSMSREIIFRTPLYKNATLSQPALRLQGAIVGVGIMLLATYAAIERLRARGNSFPRFAFEWAATGMLGVAVIGAVVGYVNRHQTVYVLGDTYRLLVVPLTCFATVVLVPNLKAALRVLDWLVLTGAVGAVLLAAQSFEAIAHGESTYGKGVPSLFVLVYFLVALSQRNARWCQNFLLAVAVLGVLVLMFLSLVRTAWLVAVLAIACVTVIFPRRLSSVLAQLVLGGAIVFALLFLLYRPFTTKVAPSIRAEVVQRIDDFRGLDNTGDSDIGSSSADERRIEVQDAIADLSAGGSFAFVVGRGSGAEYPTVLPTVDPTTRPGHRHQIHVTWVSALYRTGLAGLTILVVLVLTAISTAWRGLKVARRHAGALRAQAVLASWITASAVALTSVYGLIGEPIWGIALGLLGVVTRSRLTVPDVRRDVIRHRFAAVGDTDGRPLRVLVNGVAARYGGALTYLQAQLAALARLKALSLTVYAPEDVAHVIAEKAPGVTVHPVRQRPLISRLIWEQAVLPRLARDCDVIYLPGNFALFLTFRPQVVALQNPHHFGFQARKIMRDRYPVTLRLRILVERFAARASVRRSTHIVAISHSIKACVEEDLGSRKNLDVVLSATPDLPVARSTPDEPKYALAVAYDYLHKDWDHLALTFASDPRLPPLKIVGGWRTDERLDRLKTTLDRHGDAGRVQFIGPVMDRQELSNIYAGACCLIAHSYLEAFPLTPYEAMSQRVPVVASDIPPHREVCGQHAVYYAMGEAESLRGAVQRALGSGRQEPPKVLMRSWQDNAAELAAVLRHAAEADRGHGHASRIATLLARAAVLRRLPRMFQAGR